MSHSLQDEISLNPSKEDFQRFSWSSLRSDLFAGLTVSMLTVPQGLAYAIVAGLPVTAGLYASIFAAILVAWFGSSRHLVVGPSNAIAILLQAGIAEVLFTYYRDVSGPEKQELILQILSQVMLLVGLVQIMAAFLRLGRLTHFVSHTVIVGYLGGVAFALVVNQMFPLLGLEIPKETASLFERFGYILTHLHLTHWPTAAIGLGSLGFLMIVRRLDKRVPGGAVMLAVVALCSFILNYLYNYFSANDYQFLDWARIENWSNPIAVVGDTKGDGLIPSWSWPYFNPGLMNNLLPVSFAIALLSVIEAVSASKSIAASSGQPLSVNQEIFGLGIGNFLSAFIGGMPSSGSASRSSLIYESGGKTRLAAIFNCLFAALFLYAFGFLIKHLPIAAFSALLIASSVHIIKFKQLFLCLKATRSDFWVLVLTFSSCIFFSLDMAFYIGVILSITLYLKKSAIPQLAEFTVDESGILRSLHESKHAVPKKIRLIKVEGELFFGAADIFQNTLKSITEDDTTTKVIILQLKNARDIDATACLALQQLYEYLKNSGRYLVACGIPYQIWEVLSDSGIIDLIGKANLFIFDERHPNLSVQKAFVRANALISSAAEKPIEKPLSEEPLIETSRESVSILG